MARVYATAEDVTMARGDVEEGDAVGERERDDVIATLFVSGRERYIPIDERGRGRLGTVVRAYDPRLKREVALERIRAHALSEQAREEILGEARALAKLSHPNVLAIYDVATQGEDLVLAMEHVAGSTLEEWLANAGSPRSWRDVLAAFCAAGRGLVAAHALGLLHRDFRPSNVIVGNDGRVRLTNFAVARLHGEASPNAQLVSAQQDASSRDGLAATQATDQYGFCVALWTALVGQAPFPDDADRVLAEPPLWPRNARAPSWVGLVLRRGLASQPEEQWPTMDALLQALEHEPWPQRRKWLAAGSLLATVAASASAWTVWQGELAQRCTGAQTQLEDTWGPLQRQQAQAAVLATDLAYAGEVWSRTQTRLDAYAAAWVAMHTDACEATTVRGEVPAHLMDLRMSCLHRVEVHLHAVTALLSKADAGVVEKAHQVVGGLPSLDRCADLEALQVEVQPPESADVAAVEAARVALADVNVLGNAGKYREAREAAMTLAETVRRIGYEPLLTDVLLALGDAHVAVGAVAQSEAALKEALRIALHSKQWFQATDAAGKLASTLGESQLRTAEALAHAETALGLVAHSHRNHEGDILDKIAGAFVGAGRYAESEALYRRTLKLWEGTLGPENYHVTRVRNNLANALYQQGRHAEAERELREVVELFEAQLGRDHPDVAAARINHARPLYELGRRAEAEAQYRMALDIATRTLGPDAPLVGMCRHNLAQIALSQGHFARAEVEARAAVDLHTKLYGSEHPVVTLSRNAVAAILLSLERYEEAEAELRAVLTLQQRVIGPQHHLVADTRTNLGEALFHQRRFADAEAEHRAALTMRETALGTTHPAIAQSRLALGRTLLGQGRLVEAESEHREALTIRQNSYGPNHPDVAEARFYLGQLLLSRGRPDEAEAELRAALVVREESLGRDHLDVAHTRSALADVLAKRALHEEAARLFMAAAETFERALGPDHRLVAETNARLGDVERSLRSGRARAARMRH